MRARVVVLLAALLVAGCAATPGPAAAPPLAERPGEAPAVPPPADSAAESAAEPAPPASVLGARAAELAAGLVGRPYRYGGATPSGFDCSGLVYYVYQSLGQRLPRTAAAQRTAIARVPMESLAPGDLVFFATPVDHVGIYLGGGEFVHAPGAGRGVERARLDSPYFLLGYAGAGRVSAP